MDEIRHKLDRDDEEGKKEMEKKKIQEEEKDKEVEVEDEQIKEEETSSEDKKESEEEDTKKRLEKARKDDVKAALRQGLNKTPEKKDNELSDEDKDKKKFIKSSKINFKNILMLIFIVVVIMSLPSIMKDREKASGSNIKYSDFVKGVENGEIIDISEKSGYIYGVVASSVKEIAEEKEGAESKEDKKELLIPKEDERTHVNARMISDRLYQDTRLMSAIEATGVDVTSKDPEQMPLLLQVLISWFPMLLLIGIWIFMLNKMNKGGGGGPQIFNMGKSKAKENGENTSQVTFDDVAGIEESKVELQEVVEFLKEPEKYREIGAKIPKGVLLLGEPGTGKTLLAKAVAGEAGVPFFSISGSEFVEMFVGVGASRVRDLFNKARKNAPCIVFIDEIDAVGRKRGAGQGGGNDEREQTLNQLLVEMDGFGTDETIIVIAATNRAEILDSALMRPGRFDRQVVVDRPDLKGREEILKVHLKGKKLSKDVDLTVIARKTPGFVGADLANMLNEAAILAAREGRKEITMEDLEEASEKVSIGPERKSRVTVEKEKNIVAYHEVGHALVQMLIPHTEPVHKVTVVPRGMAALGYTMTLPTEDRYLKSKNEFLAELRTLLAGRAAEEIVFEDITTGASNDIERATAIAHAMVTKFGMTEKFGPILLDNTKEGDIFMQKYYSDSTGKDIDAEIRGIINAAYDDAKRILRENYELLERISKLLLERETITGSELQVLIDGGELEPLKHVILKKDGETLETKEKDEIVEGEKKEKVDEVKVEVEEKN